MGLTTPIEPCPPNCQRRRLVIPGPFPLALDHFIGFCDRCNAVLNFGRDHAATAALAAQALHRKEYAREEPLRQTTQAAEKMTPAELEALVDAAIDRAGVAIPRAVLKRELIPALFAALQTERR